MDPRLLRAAGCVNRDGFGYSFIRYDSEDGNDGVYYRKSMDLNRILDEFNADKTAFPDSPFLFHFRIATHGTVDVNNVHPFIVTGKIMVAHNGILRMVDSDGPEDGRSDTKLFVDKILKPLSKENPNFLDDAVTMELMREYIGGGNKLAFIQANGQLTVVNASAGREHEGVWWSNDHHFPSASNELWAAYSDPDDKGVRRKIGWYDLDGSLHEFQSWSPNGCGAGYYGYSGNSAGRAGATSDPFEGKKADSGTTGTGGSTSGERGKRVDEATRRLEEISKNAIEEGEEIEAAHGTVEAVWTAVDGHYVLYRDSNGKKIRKYTKPDGTKVWEYLNEQGGVERRLSRCAETGAKPNTIEVEVLASERPSTRSCRWSKRGTEYIIPSCKFCQHYGRCVCTDIPGRGLAEIEGQVVSLDKVTTELVLGLNGDAAEPFHHWRDRQRSHCPVCRAAKLQHVTLRRAE